MRPLNPSRSSRSVRRSKIGTLGFRPRCEELEARYLPSILPLYYSYNGTGNNLANPTWGSAGTDLLRVAGVSDADGSGAAVNPGPDARLISNIIGTQITDPEPNNLNLTDMIYAWGQFIDHDLDLTPSGGVEYVPISVPTGDSTFDPTGTGTAVIDFFRDVFDPTTGTSAGNPRQFPNEDTSFLDGGMVYGNNPTTAAALRTFVGGQLKTSFGDLLPFDTMNIPIENDTMQLPNTQLFLGGDIRANENAELTSMDVLFVREHNFQAALLAQEHPTWNDEQLYQGARQIVIAEIQANTFNEYLPALLGVSAITPYTGYNPNVNPGITAEFSTAAFRLGHSQVNQNIDFFNDDGSESHDPEDFNLSADNPSLLLEPGASVDRILKYLVTDNAQEVDPQIEDSLRDQLFAPADPSMGGSDLFAIDIQRGRDLGLPDYNTVRVEYGLAPVTSFNQITSDPTVQAELRQIYGTNAQGQDNVNNIDLFVGGLAEDHVPGGDVGPLFTAIIANQFERIRDGDRLWYQNIFSGPDLQKIQSTTLDQIISRNTTMHNLPDDAFFFTTGTIAGHVFADVNLNGILDYGEMGLGNITIQLLDSNGNVVGQTTTATDGTYSFDTASIDPNDVGINPVNFDVRIVTPSGLRLTSTGVIDAFITDNSGAGQFGVDFGLAAPNTVVTGVDLGVGAEIKIFNATTGALTADFTPFPASFTGGVRVATGDINGDFVPDIVAAAGPGGSPEVKVFDGATMQLIRDFYAFPATFTGGVWVAVGDINGDGYGDIIVGAGAGGAPEVKVFNGKDGSLLLDFYAFPVTFSGGVRVAAADVDGDGLADIIVGAGPGAMPEVKLFSGLDGSLLGDFLAFSTSFRGGVYVSALYHSGSDTATVVVGAGAGGGPEVALFNGVTGQTSSTFYAFPGTFTGGVRVSSTDQGRGELVVSAGPGGLPEVEVFDNSTLALLDAFFAYDPLQTRSGVLVG